MGTRRDVASRRSAPSGHVATTTLQRGPFSRCQKVPFLLAISTQPDDPRNPTVNFHGARRRNDTHQSTTDLQARLYRKGPGREATLAYLGHVLLDNRHGPVANVCVTAATGTAEREAASWMLAVSAPPGSTVGADKGYDVARFVDEARFVHLK